MVTAGATARLKKRREQERYARQRRVARLEHMRSAHSALQRTVLVVHTLDDQAWERFLDPDALRLRRFLHHSMPLNQQRQALEREQVELQRLLREHELASSVYRRLLAEFPIHDWDWNVRRWKCLTRAYFRPWTREACQEQIVIALSEINTLRWSTDKRTTRAQVLGWRDLQRVDHLRRRFQFQFTKTFRGLDVMEYVNAAWDIYSTASGFNNIIMGHRARASHDVLQQIGPNIVLFRTAEHFPAVSINVHVVYILFRIKTERGFIQCVRSVPCPELVDSFAGQQDSWPSNFIWLQWELDDNGYELRIGGSVGGTDVRYANMWMIEAFSCLVRSEQLATGQQLIRSD